MLRPTHRNLRAAPRRGPAAARAGADRRPTTRDPRVVRDRAARHEFVLPDRPRARPRPIASHPESQCRRSAPRRGSAQRPAGRRQRTERGVGSELCPRSTCAEPRTSRQTTTAARRALSRRLRNGRRFVVRSGRSQRKRLSARTIIDSFFLAIFIIARNKASHRDPLGSMIPRGFGRTQRSTASGIGRESKHPLGADWCLCEPPVPKRRGRSHLVASAWGGLDRSAEVVCLSAPSFMGCTCTRGVGPDWGVRRPLDTR